MQDVTKEKDKDYCSFSHKYWGDLLSTTEAKDNRKQAAAQIKRLAVSKAALENYDSNTSGKVLHKKKARTSVLPDRKKKGKKPPNYKGFKCY